MRSDVALGHIGTATQKASEWSGKNMNGVLCVGSEVAWRWLPRTARDRDCFADATPPGAGTSSLWWWSAGGADGAV